VARPIIGISTYLEPAARWGVWELPAALVPTGYPRHVQRAGGIAALLPPDDPVHAADTVARLDGLVIIGGQDVEPVRYGAEPDPRTGAPARERDAWELALMAAALAAEVPLLGICRGMQLLNVALGGTLIQHLPDDVGHGDHRRHLGSFDGADHDVRLAPGSLAAQVCGELTHATKSHHHQGVDQLGEGLVASGWSVLDDLVEAIEAPDAYWVLGVQWHPEVDPDSPVVAAVVGAAANGRRSAPPERLRPARR
jgi:putative glutamine amidotransferase